MSHGWEYKSGDWHLICDVCSRKIWASQSRKRWDGFQVCAPDFNPGCWEERQPLDFIRARQDKISVPYTRPQGSVTYVSVSYVDTDNSTVPAGTFNTDTL